MFKFSAEDTEHLNLFSEIIKNIEKDIEDKNKIKNKFIFFIIHLKRIFNKNEKEDTSEIIKSKNFSHLNTDFEQRFIDNLKEFRNKI